MSLISLKQLLDYAADHNFGMPAFNVNNIEQIKAVMQAAYKVNSPVIMQASSKAWTYAGNSFLKKMFEAALEEYPRIPVCIHQDHGADLKICMHAVNNGFSSVMIDGSLLEDGKTPSSYEYNLNITKKVVEKAHKTGVSVEGELGCLGSLETMKAGEEDGHGSSVILDKCQLLTDPNQAKDFVDYTNVDALAVAIGTTHGAYKFSKPPTKEVLDIDRIIKINKKIPNTHLVLHGSSSIEKKWLKIIRENGGEIDDTYGVPIKEITTCIKNGVRKINIDTDIRLAMTAGIRRAMNNKKNIFDIRYFLKEAIYCAQEVCEDRFIKFGSTEHADKIKPKSLINIAKTYE